MSFRVLILPRLKRGHVIHHVILEKPMEPVRSRASLTHAHGRQGGCAHTLGGHHCSSMFTKTIGFRSNCPGGRSIEKYGGASESMDVC